MVMMTYNDNNDDDDDINDDDILGLQKQNIFICFFLCHSFFSTSDFPNKPRAKY